MDVGLCFIVLERMIAKFNMPQIKRLQRLIYMSVVLINDAAKLQHFPHSAKFIFYMSIFCSVFIAALA